MARSWADAPLYMYVGVYSQMCACVKHVCACVQRVCVCVFVGNCLATYVFIGKLQHVSAMG